MSATNRILCHQPDYLLTIVRKPGGWQPSHARDIPTEGEVLSTHFIASFEEAYDDLVRCNELALRQKLDTWAVIQIPDAGL